MQRILIICIFLILATVSFASYVRYINSDGSYSSISSGTYEFFGAGNGSISIYQGPLYPNIYTQYSGGLWVAAANGDVPSNAFVDHYVNGLPIFLCRSLYNNTLYQGLLIPGEGCYLRLNYNNTVRVNVYDVLLR